MTLPKINTDRIARKFEENPVLFMTAAAGVLIAVSKVIEAHGNAKGSKAYAKQVDYRIANHK